MSNIPTLPYRKEVDGLRAVALLPVIAFHAGIAAVPAGFVGVDVFFVVSGYLITALIIAELDGGRFTLTSFYERRARRLLPALFLVLFVCLPFAWIWLLPNEFREFCRALPAIALFVSNLFFWHETGYFNTAAEITPLLHTWSLGVEEQFYLLFPLLLALVWRRLRPHAFVLVVLVTTVSFALACWGAASLPSAAFFLLPTRAWEIALGALVALDLHRRGTPITVSTFAQMASLAGLVLIAVAVTVLSPSSAIPGAPALIPTLGAALVLRFAWPGTLVAKILGWRWVAGLGLVSYSAYLWHHPMFAFARLERSGSALPEPGPLAMSLLGLASIGLAYLSWRFVEQPFRNRQHISRRQVVGFASVGAALLIAIGMVGNHAGPWGAKLPPHLAYESLGAKIDAIGDLCELAPVPGYDGVTACVFGDPAGDRPVMLYGDSHALALGHELHRRLVAMKRKGVKLHLGSCEAVPLLLRQNSTETAAECERRFQALLSYVRVAGTDLVVSARWSFGLFPVAGEIERREFTNSEGGREHGNSELHFVANDGQGGFSPSAEAKRTALLRFLAGLASTGIDVHLVHAVPEIGWDIARLNVHRWRATGTAPERIDIPHSDFVTRNRFVERVLADAERGGRLHAIRPEEIFCDTYVPGRCVAQLADRAFYFDDDHLSDEGAALVLDRVFGPS